MISNRRALPCLSVVLALALSSAPALADAAGIEAGAKAEGSFELAAGPVDAQEIAATLGARGYTRIEISRTLLGRLMFTATARDHVRELVVHPRTGEILRDVIITRSGNADARGSAEGPGFGAEFGARISDEARSGSHRGQEGGMSGSASGGVSAEARGQAGGNGAGVGVDAGVGAGVGLGRGD